MKGFSLIELMVVIAIVALLATVSVQTYSSYRARAYFGMAMSSIDGVIGKAKVYYSAHDVFPSSADLGMSDIAGLNYNQIDSFASFFNFGLSGNCFGTSYYINTNIIGLGSDGITESGQYFALINTLTADVDGVFETHCQYQIIGPSGHISKEYLSNSTCEHYGITGAPVYTAFQTTYCS